MVVAGLICTVSTADAQMDMTVPGAPTGLAGFPTGTDIFLFWTAPEDEGGTSITGYKIEYLASSSGGTEWGVLEENSSSTLENYRYEHAIVGGVTLKFRVSGDQQRWNGCPLEC